MFIASRFLSCGPVVASSTNGNNGGSNISTTTVTLPTGIRSGDILLIFIGNSGGSSATGWTLATTNSGTIQMLYRVADGTEGATVTVSQSLARSRWFCVRIINARSDMKTMNNLSWFNSSNTANPVVPTDIIPSWGGDIDLVICVADINTSTTWTSRPANNGTPQFQSLGTQANVWTMGVDWGWMTGKDNQPGNYVAAASSNWNSLTVALH